MTKIWLAIVSFLFFLSTATGNCADPSPYFPNLPPLVQSSVERTLSSRPGDLFVVLKNGFTVLVRQDTGSDVVSSKVFVRAGSIYEGQYLTGGLSHYLEHVVSGGSTRSFTEAEATRRLKEIGGETNAYTSFDRTVYYIDTSAEHWESAVDLLLSYVSESTLDPMEVAREKPVIQQEIKMGENDAERELSKLFFKTAYRVHPVRNPVIGYEDVFIRQDRNALMDYYTRRYQPGNMVLVVVGNVDPFQVLQFVVDETRDIVRRPSEPLVLPSEPDQLSSRWQEEQLPIARLTQAMIGFPSVTLQDKDLYALDVLSFLLGEGETSRLHQRLKDRENLVLSVSAANWTPTYVNGQFIISMDLPEKNWPEVLDSVREEIDRFKTEPIAAEELIKAKKTVIAHHVFGKETVSAMASSLGSSYFDTGNPYFDEQYVEGIRSVTSEQIQRVAQRYLNMDRINVAAVRPPGGEKPAMKAAVTSKAPPVELKQMDNGLKLLIKEDHSLPLVTIQLYGLGGLYLEDQHKEGISAFTASLLTAGTRQRTRLEIARAIEEVGGMIESSSDNNTYHIAIKVLKDDLDTALDILADVVQNTQFPQEEIEKHRKDTLLAIQRQDESWQTELVRLFKKAYFVESPYRHERLGTEDTVKSFTRADLTSFYHRMVNPRHSVLAVSGDVDRNRVLAQLEQKLGSWTGEDVSLPELSGGAASLKSDRVKERKNEKTSAGLFIGTNGLAITNPEKPVLDVLNAVLSGAGGPMGRLFESLRGGNEDLVYVVGSFPFYGIHAGYFAAITQTTFGNLDKVQTSILANLERLREEPVSEAELKTAKNMLLTAHRMNLESPALQARSAALDEVLGLGYDYDERYDELIEAVTAEQIQNLARKLFTNTLIVRTLPERPVEILSVPGPSRGAGAEQ